MCGEDEEVGVFQTATKARVEPTLEGFADYLCSVKGGRSPSWYWAYGEVSPGDKVLVAVTNHQDRVMVEAISNSLKAHGAKSVDVLTLDEGEDRDITYEDEIRVIIRDEPWWVRPRWYDYQEKVIRYAMENGYDFLIHGRGGPIPKTDHDGVKIPFKFETIPWNTQEQFLNDATVFPPDLNALINKKTWDMIYKQGRGGKVRVSDPEGTELEFTLNEKYFDREMDDRGGFGPSPVMGHLFSHPTPPIIPEEDASGVIKGTTAHLTRPFPRISVHLEAGRVERIEGGARYGDEWNAIMHETEGVQYPEFPRKGLFWLWELAVGSNPKVRRLSNVLRLASGGNEWERRRSGVIHVGFGTRWRGPSERWAAQSGIKYGHLHVHLLFPTYEIRTAAGRTVRVIENGRLTALDDPDVVSLARKYGDPEVLLKEDWIPGIPGINREGSYDDFAADPASWIGRFG